MFQNIPAHFFACDGGGRGGGGCGGGEAVRFWLDRPSWKNKKLKSVNNTGDENVK